MNNPKYIRRPYAFPLDFINASQLAASAGFQALIVTGDVGITTVFTHLAFKSTGDFLVQLRPTDLNGGLFNAPISSLCLLAALDRPGVLPAPLVVRGANTVRVELTNDNGAIANDVRFVLWGYRDFLAVGNC